MDTKVLFKNRSITSCMKAAYDYTGSHFTHQEDMVGYTHLCYSDGNYRIFQNAQ